MRDVICVLMKRISIVRLFFALAVIVAVATNFLLPPLDIDLYSDFVTSTDGTAEDRAEYAKFLGRTDYSSKAWLDLESGNQMWKRKKYQAALDRWWRTSSTYKDTDASYAALSNIGEAQVKLGNRGEALGALQLLLLLPEPKFHDLGMPPQHYRHNACLRIADYYETCGEYVSAERFVFQALTQDRTCETCGVAAISTEMGLNGRLDALRQKKTEKRK